MRPPVRQRGGGLRLNLTPLIDVIFNLIIFFLAASHFARNEPATAVELPTATRGDRGDDTPRRLTITVVPGENETPAYLVAGKAEPVAAVEALLLAAKNEAGDQPFEARFRADHRVPFGAIEPLLVACAKAGVRDVKFAVISPEEK